MVCGVWCLAPRPTRQAEATGPSRRPGDGQGCGVERGVFRSNRVLSPPRRVDGKLSGSLDRSDSERARFVPLK